MVDSDQATAHWRKASRSNGTGECVEVAPLPGHVGVRDSKDRVGPTLGFSNAAWQAFVAGLRIGDPVAN